ncbi:hypothetical protein GCM10009754_00610 [Amycolatopsis minnesotensis]|uniref:Nucleotidyl transferase domain-containing protein n=2 Tax=Amycolatopsis minnesotensis TaxID=337894 RepID=A0ABP5B9A2_9PSEU
MRPLTEKQPKLLLPVSGGTFLDYQLDWLHRQGVARVVFCLGHLSHLVVTHLRTCPWRDVMDLRVSDEQKQALGTAGAVRLAIEAGLLGDSFLTLYGDTLPDMDLPSAVDLWQDSGLQGMLTVYRVTSGAAKPTALIESGRVTEFVRSWHGEHRQLSHADYGVSGFHRATFQKLAVGVRSGFAALHRELAQAGQLAAIEIGEPPLEIGSHAGYRAALSALTGRPCQPPSA